ncbi:MAG: efflux RND transporter periplasmic adaptor subunit [Planctomycetes bacterium]|nr:efflux RND transporter periplasmic adaptor subunit [Planctomycetota bacterium]
MSKTMTDKLMRPAKAITKIQVLLALIVLGIGISGMLLLKYTRKAPVKVAREIVAPLVKVQVVRQQDIQMIIKGYGTVQPKVQAEVVPQVSGKIVAIHPKFKNGGFVRANQPLVTIDPRDYELAVQRTEAEVAKAEVDLDIEMAEGEVARHEWDQLNPGKEPPSTLVVHEPQIRQAQTRLEAARAELATAELNLERTRVSLPFDGRVMSETVDLGQYINVGQSIGKMYGINAVEIELPLEDEELAWFFVPSSVVSMNGKDYSNVGSEVEVHANFAGGKHIWQGKVIRATGQVDASSRLVSIVIEVKEPFKNNDSRPPLVPGMFVESHIKGKVLKGAMAVPRDVIHGKNKVWVVRNSKLHIQELKIVRMDKDYAYVVSGLEDGARIILSSLDTVTNGMRVRTEEL